MRIIEGNYNQTLEIYDSLTEQEKLWVAPRGRSADFPLCLWRLIAVNDYMVPVGFLDVYAYRMYESKSKKDEGLISLAVKKEYCGKGIANQLLQKVFDKAKDYSLKNEKDFILLYEVDDYNKGAMKLAEHFGFSLSTEKIKNNKLFMMTFKPISELSE